MNQRIDNTRIAARGFRTLTVPALFLFSACADRVSAPSADKGDAPLPGFIAVSAPRLSVIGPPLMRSGGERTFLFRDGTSYSVLTADGNLIPGAAIPQLFKSASTTGQFLGDFAISSSPAWGIFYSAKMNHMGTNSEMKTSLNYLIGGETNVTMESEPILLYVGRARHSKRFISRGCSSALKSHCRFRLSRTRPMTIPVQVA